MDGQVTPATMSSREPIKLMPQARLSILILSQTYGCLAEGFSLPKALPESKIKFSFSSFSVTLLRLNVYLSNHTWYQAFSNQHLLPINSFPLLTQCSTMDQAVSLATRSR
jgi:hypothetical protein